MPAPRTTWGLGEYRLMAERLDAAALAVVELVAVGPDDRVLDVATGTGNAALLAAGRGASAIGVDVEPVLLSLAGARRSDDGSAAGWVAGEAAALPFPDAAADAVLSVFGVMYAGDHDGAASELARVAVPGGRIGLASWVPGGVLPAMGAVLGPYLPPPPAGSGPPARWGDEAELAALLGAHGVELTSASTRSLPLSFPNAEVGADFLVRTAGHVVAARGRLEGEGRWRNLHADVVAFVDDHGARGGDGGIDLRLDYLLASATKLG